MEKYSFYFFISTNQHSSRIRLSWLFNAKTKKILNNITIVIIINGLLFSFLHIIFPKPQIMLPLALMAGLGFAFIYYKFQNLILISLSHGILNFFAVLYGLFSF